MLDRRGSLNTGSFYDVRKEHLTLISTSCYLVCVTILYLAVERKISQSSDQRIHSVLGANWNRGSCLFRSMNRLQLAECPMIMPAIRTALQLSAEIMLKDPHSPGSISLLGYFFAFERFQFDTGFSVHILPKEHSEFQSQESWTQFNDRFNSILLNEEETKQVSLAVSSAFIKLEKIIKALLHYENGQLQFHITAVNPEAGSHSIPQDPSEIKAAILAGIRSNKKYPYLNERYGERGERFTASDSCWIFSLLPLKLESIQENISWLQVVLAKRGLPSIILETHLEEIIQICNETVPDKREEIEKISKIVSKLKSDRYNILEQDWFDGHRDSSFESGLLKKLGPVTALLASAWVDEMTGIQGAFEIVQNWFNSPTRFNQEWISHVNSIVRDITAKKDQTVVSFKRIIPEPPSLKRGTYD